MPSGVLSLIVGLAGLMAVLGGVVILLRRRDYRAIALGIRRPGCAQHRARRRRKKQD